MDMPGTGRSEGRWDPVSRREGEAVHDLIEYSAAQPWSTGEVGMIGMSYSCWSQWNEARTRPPHLKTIGAFDGATDMYRDSMYQGGIPTQSFLNSWLFGSVLLQHQAQGHEIRGGGRGEVVYDMYAHPFDDAWQRTRSPFWELGEIDIPVFSIKVWGKAPLHLRGNVLGFERVSGSKQLLITGANSFPATQALRPGRAGLLPGLARRRRHLRPNPQCRRRPLHGVSRASLASPFTTLDSRRPLAHPPSLGSGVPHDYNF